MYCFHLLNLSTSNIKAKSLQFHVKRNRTNFPEQESPYDCSRLAKSDLLNSIRLQNAKCIHAGSFNYRFQSFKAEEKERFCRFMLRFKSFRYDSENCFKHWFKNCFKRQFDVHFSLF